MSYAPGEFPRLCTKCRSLVTEGEWLMLEMVGLQEVPGDPDDHNDPEPYTLELRNHMCKTTMAARLIKGK